MGRPVTGYAYLDDVPGGVIAMAHRGGAAHPALLGLENTLKAFQHAAALGYRYLETDVHATRDGELIAFHDAVLDRVTDATGTIADLDAATVARARIGGVEPIPRLADLLEALPEHRFNIDLKADGAVEPLARLLAATRAEERVCVGAFGLDRLNRFRRLTRGRVPTSAAPVEVASFVTCPAGRLARALTRGRVAVLQVPHRRRGLPIVTRTLVRTAHSAGAQVHVWTVDDPAEMVALLDLGVDGLITDRTDLLKDVLTDRGFWRDPRMKTP